MTIINWMDEAEKRGVMVQPTSRDSTGSFFLGGFVGIALTCVFFNAQIEKLKEDNQKRPEIAQKAHCKQPSGLSITEKVKAHLPECKI